MGMEALAIGAGVAALGIGQGYLNGKATAEQAEAEAKASAINSAASASNMLMQGKAAKANSLIQAANYDAQADYYLRAAGNAQLQGRDERAMRSILLGQDKGSITSQAAGSGIEVGSKVVRKTISDTVKSAYHDMEMSARNEYEAAYGAMKNRAVAKTNAANARSIGAWTEEAYSKIARDTVRHGAVTAGNILDTGYNNAAYGFGASILGGAISGVGVGMNASASGF